MNRFVDRSIGIGVGVVLVDRHSFQVPADGVGVVVEVHHPFPVDLVSGSDDDWRGELFAVGVSYADPADGVCGSFGVEGNGIKVREVRSSAFDE